MTNPNFLKFADAYGITGTRVDNLSDFRRALEQHVGSNRPHLMELTVDLRDPP